MKTAEYRRQHSRLRTLLAEISSHLIPLDARATRAGLRRLANVLQAHLALEDGTLYPGLVRHDDAAVRELAREYQARMGGLAENFEAFYRTWRRPGQIESAAYEFAVAYRAFSSALRQRMDSEDESLYRLVDKAS